MPELAAVYATGFVACAALTLLFIFLIRRRRGSSAYQVVHENLRRAGLYWSENLDRIVPWTDTKEEKDRVASERTVAFTGSLLCFLSWAGVAFLLIIMVSYRYLARSRLERALLASPIATTPNLSEDETRRLAAEFAPSLRGELSTSGV